MTAPRFLGALKWRRVAEVDASDAQQHVSAEFLKVRARLHIYAKSLTQDHDRAEDLLHDVYVRVMDNAQAFQPGTNFAAWSFRLMRNHFLDDRRRKKNQAHVDVTEMVIPTPARQEDGMRTRTLARYLMLLPTETRRILLLAGLEGLPYENIADMQGVTVGTVKSRISRARDLLDGAL